MLGKNNQKLNYFELESGPRTRIGPGEWTEDLILVSASSGLIEPHQIWA